MAVYAVWLRAIDRLPTTCTQKMNSARARALARATSERLGADGHIVNEDGDLMLLMTEWNRFKDMSHHVTDLSCVPLITVEKILNSGDV